MSSSVLVVLGADGLEPEDEGLGGAVMLSNGCC